MKQSCKGDIFLTVPKIRVFNPDYVEYDEMKFLEKFNKRCFRDEYEITTLVHNYNQQNKAFEKKNVREFNAKERNVFAVESRIDKDRKDYNFKFRLSTPI